MSETAAQSVQLRLARLIELYGFGHKTRDEYLTAHAELAAELRALAREDGRPSLDERREELRSLVTLWPDATADERRRLLASIFERIETDERGFSAGRLREGWRPYVATVLRLYQERKTRLRIPTRTFALVRQPSDRVALVRPAV